MNYHSGIIYKSENLLWLFSTGTIYPHEKQISPYVAFTYKYHNGDFSVSAKDLYNQGFGDRLKKELEETKYWLYLCKHSKNYPFNENLEKNKIWR